MRILIAHPFGIGDALFSFPMVRGLREAHPDGFLAYACNRRTEELIAACPDLNSRIVFEKDEFRSAWKRSRREGASLLRDLLQRIKNGRFDLLIDLSLGWHTGFIGRLAGVPRRIGFDYRGRGRFLTDRLQIDGFQDQPVSQYYLDLLILAGIPPPADPVPRLPLPPGTAEKADAYLSRLGIPTGKPLIGFVPGGGASWGPNAVYKQWPPERFARVAQEVGRRRGAYPILLGDAQDADACRQVERAMGAPGANVALDLPSLPLLAGLLKRCDLVIGNDSGLMHLAAAVGTRTVSIFGPVDGSVYGPHPKATGHRVVSKGLACRPCYQQFRFPPCPWGNICLKELPVESVMEAVDDLLEPSS